MLCSGVWKEQEVGGLAGAGGVGSGGLGTFTPTSPGGVGHRVGRKQEAHDFVHAASLLPSSPGVLHPSAPPWLPCTLACPTWMPCTCPCALVPLLGTASCPALLNVLCGAIAPSPRPHCLLGPLPV